MMQYDQYRMKLGQPMKRERMLKIWKYQLKLLCMYVSTYMALLQNVQPSISKIRVKDIGRLITIKGTVIRSGAIKLLEGERLYECNKCKYRFKIYPDLETGNLLQQPTSCPSQRTKPCTGTSFHAVEGTTVCHDYHEIKIQENVHMLGVGSVPRSISVVLKDDLVDTVKAGGKLLILNWEEKEASEALRLAKRDQ
ncbi:hypothetical protein L7F22_003751 [Adiantum nelumboides]|nr:hypothetical protein [Adiantum nelumboides]